MTGETPWKHLKGSITLTPKQVRKEKYRVAGGWFMRKWIHHMKSMIAGVESEIEKMKAEENDRGNET